MRHIRTAATDRGEQKAKQAFRMMAEATADLTIWEFEEYIRGNLSDLGGRGFVASIGRAIQDAATLDLALKPETGTRIVLSAKTRDTRLHNDCDVGACCACAEDEKNA